jgi:type-F conjugative transfer system secretin TraK
MSKEIKGKNLITAVLAISMLAPVNSLGYQRIFSGPGGEVKALVSRSGLNRIGVEGSRITAIRGIAGEFDYDKDTNIGEIYLKLLGPEPQKGEGKPVYAFITTDSGKSYRLELLPKAKLPETISIVPEGEQQKENRLTSREVAMTSLIKAMAQGDNITGYELKKVKIRLPAISGARVTHIESYMGKDFSGEVLEVSNGGREEIMLSREDFSYRGVEAVAIGKTRLEPKEATRVFIVRR